MADALDVNISHNSNPKLLLINDSRYISVIVISIDAVGEEVPSQLMDMSPVYRISRIL
jgi:hypothetical protein